MKCTRMKIINFRKFNDNPITLNFGKKITVISGVNGIGKSSLLALLASASGTNNKRINGLQFQPEFTDLFSIDKNENYQDYRIFVEFDKKIHGKDSIYYLTKRISFKNDEKSGRGIRLIPRTCPPIENNSSITLKQAEKEDIFGSGAKRVPIPTEYVSLSRLVPLGESKVNFSKIRIDNKIVKEKYTDFFKKCYNSVLEDSISDDSIPTFVNKRVGNGNRKYLSLNVNKTTGMTLSVGQDNLEVLTAAFTDFYALKKELGERYQGGILCIDEIDASLHPSAVKKLWTLLKNLTDELDLQIFLTSHSLTVLKSICRSQEKDYENYRLLYFRDCDHPRLSETKDYEALKADMFDQINFQGPKIKVYCEDENGKSLFDLLKRCMLKNSNNKELLKKYFEYYNLESVGICLGKEHLKKLPKKDEYFKKVLIVLDGDARLKAKFNSSEALTKSRHEFEQGLNESKKTTENIVRLPSYYSPEIYIYKVLEEVCNNYSDYNSFWSYVDSSWKLVNYTTSRLKKEFKIDKKNIKYEDIHNEKWMAKALEFAEESNLLTYYYDNKSHKDEILSFEKEFMSALEAVRKSKSRSIFE